MQYRAWAVLLALTIGPIGCVASACLVLALGSATRAAFWDPIGAGNDYGILAGNAFCSTKQIARVASVAGKVAELRSATCWPNAFNSATTGFFVFVHDPGRPTSRANLAFRYVVADDDPPPPDVTWLEANTLEIDSAKGPVTLITAQRYEVGDVRITYALATPDCPAQLDVWHRVVANAWLYRCDSHW